MSHHNANTVVKREKIKGVILRQVCYTHLYNIPLKSFSQNALFRSQMLLRQHIIWRSSALTLDKQQGQ